MGNASIGPCRTVLTPGRHRQEEDRVGPIARVVATEPSAPLTAVAGPVPRAEVAIGAGLTPQAWISARSRNIDGPWTRYKAIMTMRIPRLTGDITVARVQGYMTGTAQETRLHGRGNRGKNAV